MPAYTEPFGRAGAVAGGLGGGAAGATGGGLLGWLGNLLEPLDYPRQALWNAAKGVGRAVSGEGSWDDALGAVPGLLGGALTGGLLASGVGAPLGILAGSALGGAAQGIGHATGKEAFNAPTVEDVTGTDEMVPNLLTQALLDPLTYAGGLGGARKGAQLGRSAGEGFGKGLEEAAAWRGPRYSGGAEKLDAVLQHPVVQRMGEDRLADLMTHLEYARANPGVLGEIPPGSAYLGHGVETLAMRSPEGGVVTIGRNQPELADYVGADLSRPPPTRPDLPEMVQSVRSKPFEGEMPVRVEHTPFVDIVGNQPNVPPGTSPSQAAEFYVNHRARAVEAKRQAESLADRLFDEHGVDFWDRHLGNVAMGPQGEVMISDPGAVRGMLGNEVPRVAEMPARDPTAMQRLWMWLLGSDEAVQRELMEKLAAGQAHYAPPENVVRTRPLGVAAPPPPLASGERRPSSSLVQLFS